MTLDKIVSGRHVFVLGSSPSASALCSGDRLVICVNGSLLIDPNLRPDILFINGITARNHSSDTVANHTMRGYNGRHARHIVCISRVLEFDQILTALRGAGLSWETEEEITEVGRREITERWLGRSVASAGGDDVCSTGVCAILTAIEAGAASIAVSGFSLCGGHSYIEGQTKRDHLSVDREILTRIASRPGLLGLRLEADSSKKLLSHAHPRRILGEGAFYFRRR